MRYLCLIHLDPQKLDALTPAESSSLNAAHLDLNEDLRKSGHFLIAEALDRPEKAACVRVRNGQMGVTHGPFAETKEMIAGFYMVEAEDMKEALAIAARIPAVTMGTVEVRPRGSWLWKAASCAGDESPRDRGMWRCGDVTM